MSTECALCGHYETDHDVDVAARCSVRHYSDSDDYDDYALCDCPGYEPDDGGDIDD